MKKWKLNPALPEVPVDGTTIAGRDGRYVLMRMGRKWFWGSGTPVLEAYRWPSWGNYNDTCHHTVYPANVPLYVEDEEVELRSLSKGKRFVTANGGVDGVVVGLWPGSSDVECLVGDEYRKFRRSTLVWPVEDGK